MDDASYREWRGDTPGRRLSLALLLYLASGFLPLWIDRLLGGSGRDLTTLAGQERAAILGLCCSGALVLLTRWLPRPWRWRVGGGALGQTLGLYVLFALLWIPLALVLYPWLLERAGVVLPPQPMLEYFVRQPPSIGGWLAMMALVCVIGPTFEEVVFRGYLQAACRQVMPAPAAVVLTAAVFGLLHGPLYALPVGLLGLFFGWVHERHGGLLAAIVAHAAHNTLTVLVNTVFPQVFEWVYE
ncbi:MAG: CPBP family intramembrane glutamic endopeptidase [Planctomycetota bacterium]